MHTLMQLKNHFWVPVTTLQCDRKMQVIKCESNQIISIVHGTRAEYNPGISMSGSLRDEED